MSSQRGFFRRIKQLSTPQKILFAAALCQRMQPYFSQFCQQHQKDDEKLYHEALSLVWQKVYDKKLHINYTNIQQKLEHIVPDLDVIKYAYAYPAFDAVVALITIFNALESQVDDDLNNISKLASNIVRHCIQVETETELTGEALNDFIHAHPFMQEEQAIQATLLDWVEQSEAVQKDQVKGLRQELIEQA
tara:strand:+ start:4843 stop:5415 length:573 start_codon:yes stop_codon:yes gene_type:complete